MEVMALETKGEIITLERLKQLSRIDPYKDILAEIATISREEPLIIHNLGKETIRDN